MTVYTSGPWRVLEHPSGAAKIQAGPFTILLTNAIGATADVWNANARLIAAAPELLELLKAQRERLGDGRTAEGWVAEWIEEIDVAIAKAGG